MKRTALVSHFSDVVGVTKADQIVTEAEATLGLEHPETYSAFEVRDLCDEIADSYDGYIAEIALELRVHTQAQQRFDALLENVPDPAVVTSFSDGEPIVKTVNSEFVDVFGYAKAEAEGNPLADLIVPDGEPYGAAVLAQADNGGDREVSRQTKTGQQRTFILRTAMHTTMPGEIEAYAIYTDITARKRRERDLELLTNLFSRVFRHNVRNELSVVMNRAALIRDWTADDRIEDSADSILDAADRLHSHAENTRDIEALIAAEPVVVEQPLVRLCASAIEQVGRLPEGVTVETDLPAVPVRVIHRFQTAIVDALENAIEHNPHPLRIELRGEVTETTVTLVIADDGDGIASEEIAILETDEESPLEHGSGVGLSVMQWYVEKAGGELTITGDATGTTVRMRLERGA